MLRRSFLAAGAAALISGCSPQGLTGFDGTLRGEPLELEGPSAGETDDDADDATEAEATDAPDEDGSVDLDPEGYPTTASEWGMAVTGVKTRLATDEPVIALTLDACGGPNGMGYDQDLIDLLIVEEIPATLFINHRWIGANEDVFVQLAENPLFEIANHGTEHLPLSVNRQGAYGIPGTYDPAHVINEVQENQANLEDLTGQPPRYFRSGTAHYDEVAVQIVGDLGLEVVGFDVLGDAGATFTSDEVRTALLGSRPGSIASLHMNRPGSGTAAGLRAAVPALRELGFEFTTLSAHDLE